MIVIDIWGGHLSMTHFARFIRNIDEALIISRRELLAGFLVNLRMEVKWGKEEEEFDKRVMN